MIKKTGKTGTAAMHVLTTLLVFGGRYGEAYGLPDNRAARAFWAPEWALTGSAAHHFHVVLFGERRERFSIRTMPFLEHLLGPPWRHADQYHARAGPHVLEGVCGASRDEHHGLSRRAHDAITKFDLKLPAHDVEELLTVPAGQ